MPATANQRAPRWRSLLRTAVGAVAFAATTPGGARADELDLARVETNILQVATTPEEALALARGGAGQPEIVLVGLALPESFDPARRTRILFTCVTGDPYRSNIKEMEVYRARALARGWIVLTGQPHPWPERARDTVLGRRAAAWAAFRTLAELVPASRAWPTAFAGFSGGSKTAQLLAGDAVARGRHVIGVHMAGCNEDSTPTILADYHPDEEALWAVPCFLSSGKWDRVSTPAQMRAVSRSLENHGVRHVRLETFAGPHAYCLSHITAALTWFEALDQAATQP